MIYENACNKICHHNNYPSVIVIAAVWSRRHTCLMLFRSIQCIDTQQFERSLRNSSLFSLPQPSVDGFADSWSGSSSLSWTELLWLGALVDDRQNRSHAGCTSQAAITAKRERRRLSVTELDVDRVAYRRACQKTHKRFNTWLLSWSTSCLPQRTVETAGELRGNFCTQLTLHNRDSNQKTLDCARRFQTTLLITLINGNYSSR